jgi:hypothetical protein
LLKQNCHIQEVRVLILGKQKMVVCDVKAYQQLLDEIMGKGEDGGQKH